MANGKSFNTMNPRPGKSLGAPKSLPVQTNTSTPIASNDTVTAQPGLVKQSAPAPIQKQIMATSVDDSTQHGLVAFINTVHKMVRNFANLNQQVIDHNFKVAMGDGMPAEDRTVPFETADYIISNLGYILMGMVLDNDFKQAFLDAVLIEVNIDFKDAAMKAQVRANMKTSTSSKSIGSVVLGITSFTPEMEVHLFERMTQSFTDLDAFSGEFDAEVSKMSNDTKNEYGFVFSNWMYLIRAFVYNDKFLAYVIAVIEKVKTLVSKN